MWLDVADLAALQHGVVARRQLLDVGLGGGAVEHQLRLGRLHPVYRGVYAVGHNRLGYVARCMAAVLACGDGALLSHRAAGERWGLRTGRWVEVTVPRGRPGPRGIRVHETRRVPPSTAIDRIPVTSLGRTLVDLADVVGAGRLERAFEDAERLGVLDLNAIEPIPGRKGEANIRALIEEHRPSAETRSELERRFAAFIREAGLPWPVFNTLVEGIEVDVLWRDRRVVVELDSYEHHGRARKPFEDDRQKDIRLQLAGYAVMRVTSRMLDRKRGELRAQLEQLLSRPAWSESGPARSGGARGAPSHDP